MERKIILIAHTSLDGFVANKDGNFNDFNPGKDNLDYVCSITTQADALLAGRVSFQMLDAYWPDAHKQPQASASEIKYSNWYNSAKKYVVSRSLKEVPCVAPVSGDLKSRIADIKNEPGKDIIIFGSPSLVQAIAGGGLIDEYRIILYPVLFGKGIPLFSDQGDLVKLNFQGTTQLANGEVVLSYSKE